MESTKVIVSQEEKRFIFAFLGCLFIHGVLFWLVLNKDWITREALEGTELEITTKSLVVPEWVEELFTVVQTNPDTPENEPDKTLNLSDRKQQNQQVVTSPDQKEGLKSDGDSEESKAIFSGKISLEQSDQTIKNNQADNQDFAITKQEIVQETPTQSISLLPEEKTRVKEQIFPKLSDPNKDGIKIQNDSDERPEQEKVLSKTIDLTKTPTNEDNQLIDQESSPIMPQNPLPLPRPKLNKNLLPTVIRKSKGEPLKSGSLSIEADDRFKEFVAYHRAMSEIIIKQWYQLASSVEISAEDRGTKIKITFTLEADGKIKDLKVVDSNVRTIAGLICKDAIQSPAPFRHWSPEMIEELEEAVTLQITFHY